MGQVNTIVIVSDKQELVNQISQKLVLLRSLDKVQSCSIEEASNMLEGYCPNTLILHCEDNNPNAINLVKFLKKQAEYSSLPILLINENCSRETIIEAFDNGISDVLFMPIIDYELLIRVIWCLKKNDLELKNESQINFMTSLGIIQPETGIYAQKYYEEFLKNEIAQSRKYSQQACILLISPDKKYPKYRNPEDFIRIIKKSIRTNDSVVIKDIDKFYIYLQKTKLNGVYSVFERINSSLGIDAGANAGVVEVLDQKFEDIIEALDSALAKANENTNSLIVASDFYSNEEKPALDLNNIKRHANTDEQTFSQKTQSIGQKKYNIDKNSIKIFNQAYKRKLRAVIVPVFKKYEDILKIKQEHFAINTYVGTKSSFTVSSGVVSASFNLEYDGVENVIIRLAITDDEQKRLYETETVDFTILDYRKVSLLLSELIDKFITILKGKN